MGEVTLRIKLRNGKCITDKFHVVKSITTYQPRNTTPKWTNLIGKLADENYTQLGKINVLFGVGFWIKILEPKLLKLENNLTIAQKTKLGYVIFETKKDPYKNEYPYIGSVLEGTSIKQLLDQIKKFWEVEEISLEKKRTLEEEKCEEIFINGHSRDKTGRYIVRMPFNEKIQKLGYSKKSALHQFFKMEYRMKRNPEFGDKYRLFMSEYEALGHMQRISEEGESGYYTPHHGVLSSEKFRVVFNASSKTSTGITLNECQLTGEKLQSDLQMILLNFRKYRFGITADIEKMYRQILVHPSERKFQKILWRAKEGDPIGVFELKTVTYGHTCAPHCAIRTLIQCAIDHEEKYPRAAQLVKSCFYVDDFLGGGDSLEEAEKEEELIWTKRKILSRIGQLYDPNGYLGPVIMKGKMIIQELWKDKKDWDEHISGSIKKSWNLFNDDLKNVNLISINRWLQTSSQGKMELHGFCDASEKGYGVGIYVRTKGKEGYQTEILISKSRVAPLKILSIPRLELCSASILMNAIEMIYPIFSKEVIGIYCWTDSMITLQWIKKESSTLKTFVANRVANIQNTTEKLKINWNWVMGKENPADLISRGTTVLELKDEKKWWKGPDWLTTAKDKWPEQPEMVIKNEIQEFQKEFKTIHLINTETRNELTKGKWFKFKTYSQKEFSLLDSYSKMKTLVRVTATIFKAIEKFKNPRMNKIGLDLQRAENYLIQIDQQRDFTKELESIKNGNLKMIKNLVIMWDKQDKFIRIDGRVRSENLTRNEQFPILLSGESTLAKILIREAHLKTMHGGNQLTLQYLRRKFWIMNAKRLIKGILRKCPICFKMRMKTSEQLMASLPTYRTTPSKPFSNVGVDYSGPILLRSTLGRLPKLTKAWIAVFVCLVTRAIHLELVSDATTEAFIAALRRMISRRGTVTQVVSDNGSNLVGAHNYIRNIFDSIQNNTERLEGEFNLKWNFITPRAPHQGGIYEAAVKSMKHHLTRVIGETTLTFEEYATLLSQVEACVNSRPLYALSDDPTSLNALTPAHFLIGEALIQLPDEDDYRETPINRLTRWNHIQKMTQNFWDRWQSEYVGTLTNRSKWLKENRNITTGDLVILKDENTPPVKWKMGRIQEVLYGQDGLVRNVVVRTATGVYKRPIVKIGVLIQAEKEAAL
ncbi:uncharacterized protein LOC116351270 [Contarinia nasturtii]|uniref:uncharacterized protein LOC116351270 n=1 Tax=Contarinia nasturtii TaxID=265458 RepID=UPI0012D42411|nr:uncharacterized protein LOC116351270 [Contarinia nasturtii]